MYDDKKDFVVHTMQLAKYLARRGIVWKAIKKDLKDPEKLVFFYEKTPELMCEVEQYQKRFKELMYGKQ